MKSRIHARKKSTREQTLDFSTAPAQPMFQSRPFVVQSQKTEPQQQLDLKTSLRRAERYGHHLSKMNPASLSAPKAAQLKMGMGQSVERERATAPQVVQAKLTTVTEENDPKQALTKRNLIQRVTTTDKPATTALTEEGRKKRTEEEVNDLRSAKVWAEAIFSGGKIYKKTGEVEGRKAKAAIVDGKVIFAYAPNGQIYIKHEPQGVPRPDAFTHANFLSGDEVKTAGQMFVIRGEITRLDNLSGHYKPRDSTLEWMLEKLKAEGVDLQQISLVMMVEGGEEEHYNALEYMTNREKPEELGKEKKQKDEDFQQVYDAAIGKEEIRFELLGWPFGTRRQSEWQPKIALLRLRLQRGEPTVVAIEYKPGHQSKEKEESQARKTLEQVLAAVEAKMQGEVEKQEPQSKNDRGVLKVRIA